jgi:hypothetical protein
MKRLFLVAMATVITVGAFADGGNKKQACTKCDKHCTQKCAQQCGAGCCDKATVKKN